MLRLKKPFLIAEIGINHNGDLKIAKKLIDCAKENNFDAVKFQKRDIYKVYTNEFLQSPRKSPWGEKQLNQKKGLEFGIREYKEIDKYCKKKKIFWFASAWDLNSLIFLKKFKLRFNKIASAMIVDIKFLKEVAKQKKYTFISTGMSKKKDIDLAVKIFRSQKCPFELMHCSSVYPLPVENVNLNTIIEMKKRYKCNVGYSSHENGSLVSIVSYLLGASSIEKHITLDRTMYGSDQAASIEPQGMFSLTEGITKVQKALGKNMLGKYIKGEDEVAKKLREHINI